MTFIAHVLLTHQNRHYVISMTKSVPNKLV